MALKIRPTPLLKDNAAQRILDVIESTDKIKVELSREELEKKRAHLDKILNKAKI